MASPPPKSRITHIWRGEGKIGTKRRYDVTLWETKSQQSNSPLIRKKNTTSFLPETRESGHETQQSIGRG